MKNKNIILYIILFTIFFISIIAMLHLAIYSRPCVDDYEYSSQTHKLVSSGNYNVFEIIKEAIKTDIKYYNNWQGLYTSAFILALQPGIFGEQYYFIGTWLLIALMFGCLYFFIKTILLDILKLKKYILLITMAVLSVILAGLPSAVEALYWFNGAWNYMPFFFLILVNIALLLRYLYLGKKESVIYSTLLSFIISGGNHITSVLNIGILIIFSIITIKKQKLSIIPLASAIIGFIIMYIAPGTNIRQEQLPAQGIIDTILASAERTFDFFIYWCDIIWGLTIITLLPVGYYIKHENMLKKEDLKLNPIILFATKLIIIFVLHCVPYKAMGNFGQGRVTNVIWLTHMITSCVCWIYFIIWLSFRIKIQFEYKIIIKIMLPILFIGIIFSKSSNVIKAIENVKSGEAQKFAYCCDLRYKQMRETKEDVIYVEPLPHNKMLRFDDVSRNPENWKNKLWKNYYGKNIIVKKTY